MHAHPWRAPGVITAAGALALLGFAGGGAAASTQPASSGTWHKVIEVPGIAALNAGGAAGVSSVSCASTGNCAAGGYYYDSSGHQQAFVVSEVNGTWRKAIEVPGTAALNAGGSAGVNSVSCGSAGNCAAGGDYTDSSGKAQAFVASEVNGAWRKAIEVPGTAALNAGGHAAVGSVSCGSAGNCAAGGYYIGSGYSQPFVASEANGAWHRAIEVPGIGSGPGDAQVSSVSCGSAGNCAAGGDYMPLRRYGTYHAFVASEVNGIWHRAIEVPGSAALNDGREAGVHSVSCAPAGTCAAGGYYFTDTSGHSQAFVVSQR